MFFLLALSRDSLREHLTHELEPCNQIARPGTGFLEGCESNGTDDTAADAKWDAQMRTKARPLTIFSFADCFWWKIKGGILDCEDLARAEFGKKPGKLGRKRALWRGLDPFYGGRRQNDKRAVLLEFGKGAAIESEKLPKYYLGDLNFGLDPFSRNVCKSRGEIGEHPLKCQKLVHRRIVRRRAVDYGRCKPAEHHITIHEMHTNTPLCY